MTNNSPKPVELLRDGRGVYGIGVSDAFDHQALTWACGVGPDAITQRRHEGHYEPAPPRSIILRPDRLDQSRSSGTILQKINGGFRHGMFTHTAEEHLRQFIHHDMLREHGLCWPPEDDRHRPGWRWWSEDKTQQARNRTIYHGLRLCSLSVINKLIGTALEQAADPDAVKAARRFAFHYREYIYRACARSRRALQLVDTFPLLALAIYSPSCLSYLKHKPYSLDWDQRDRETRKIDIRRQVAAQRVERGARLRDVAAAMGIPMALRSIKPGAAHLVREIFCQHPELVRFMPASLSPARNWVKLVNWAEHREAGGDFTLWAARTIPQIPGDSLNEIGSFLCDMSDWVKADRKFITRSFVPSMSLRTVTKLCAEWHEAVASQMDGPEYVFPPPWYPAATIGPFEIVPVESAAELRREGAAMHHCVGAYGEPVRSGHLCVYSVRRDGKRAATLALVPRYVPPDRRGTNEYWTAIDQLRGPCNAQPPKEITAAVLHWHRTLPPLPSLAPNKAEMHHAFDF
jgi:PcfJ-like protein